MAKKYKKRYTVTLILHGVWTRYYRINKKLSNQIGFIADNAAHHSLDTFNGSIHTYVGRVPGTDKYIN